jgi:hypothetical protein
MVGTPGMSGVATGPGMTIVGATITASVMPTDDGMIAGMTTDAEMIGVSAMTIVGATVATSGATIDAVRENSLELNRKRRSSERGLMPGLLSKPWQKQAERAARHGTSEPGRGTQPVGSAGRVTTSSCRIIVPGRTLTPGGSPAATEGHSPDMKMRHLWSRWFDRRPNRQQMYVVRAIIVAVLIGALGLIVWRFL